MQTEFSYRELSEKLDINLAKLKRWGREFLQPDETAGQQQGVARLIKIDDAFMLYLGGELVRYLKFSIPATKNILTYLRFWLPEKKILPSFCLKGIESKYYWELYFTYERSFVARGIINKTVYKSKIIHADPNFQIKQTRMEECYLHELVTFEKKGDELKINEFEGVSFIAQRWFNISEVLLQFFKRLDLIGYSYSYFGQSYKQKMIDKE